MLQPVRPLPMSISPLRLALGVIIILASALGIAVQGRDVMRQIDRQSSSGSDNVQWALSQVDVELLNLCIVMGDAVDNPAKIADLRTRFDVFYSRIKMLQLGSVFATLRTNPDFEASFTRLEAFLDKTTPLMDGPDAALKSALPSLKDDARKVLPDAHGLSLTGISVFAAKSDLRREGVKNTLIQLAVLTVALVAGLIAMLVMVLRLDRGNWRRAAENAETLSRLDGVVATSLDAVITLDDAGWIVDFNPAASLTFGYPRAMAVGRDLGILVPPDAQGRSQLPPMDKSLPAHANRLRITARHKDGHHFPAEISLTSARAGARPVHVVFLRDLSQQVAAEEALVAARDEALAGEKAKADLLVVMSHEIRTPLNGMIGTIELLDGTELAPYQREYLRIMAASGRLLMHHVNDVLDIARLDSGKATLSLAPVDLAALVREVLENQMPASLAMGNALAFLPDARGPRLVLGDAAQLRQVLLNLVGNAVKFTHDGQISVQVLHPASQGLTEIIVQDSGIGIDPDDLSRIFDDFVTLDPTYARSTSGTGLGLGIVRRIVTRMGGRISVESEAGHGARFRIALPLTVLDDAGPQEGPVPRPGATGGLQVLVVEDNQFNRLIARDMLALDGHKVTEASSGQDGVDSAQVLRFDVILMDISMPGMDGMQAAQLIRASSGASKDAAIVALTAHALPEETDRFRAGGMQDVLTKPVTRETLRAVLARLPVAGAMDGGLVDGGLVEGGLVERGPVEGGLVSGGPVERGPVDGGLVEGVPFAVPAATQPDALIDIEVWSQVRAALGVFRAQELVARFLGDTDRRIADLLAVNGDGSAADLMADVHRLGGSAAMFGAVAFHTRLAAIEDQCKRGDRNAARAALPALAAVWAKTAVAYRAEGTLAQASSLR